MNDVSSFELADAIERCHIFAFNNQFVTAAEKALNPYRGGYKIKQIKRDSFSSFIHLLFFLQHAQIDIQFPREALSRICGVGV